MANYGDLDESELQEKLSEAGSYEERSLIRQALRQKKKQRGGAVGRSKGGAASYNRFAGTVRSTAPAPKNYIATASETPNTETLSQSSKSTSSAHEEQVDIPPHVEDETKPSPLPLYEPVAPPLSQESPPTPEPSPTSPSQESLPTPEPSPSPSLHESPPTPEPRFLPQSQESPPTPEPSPPPPSQEPPPTPSSHNDVDGGTDPGLGEEEGESVDQDTMVESVPESEIVTPQTRDQSIEEQDGGSWHSKPGPKERSKSGQPSVDFGVKLRKTVPQPKSKPSTRGGLRSLRDYQELASCSMASQSPASEGQPLEADELQKYLVAYVNKELSQSPPLPTKGRALFEVASDPSNLCKLINLSVPNTVDLRALTKMPVRGSAEAKREALEENMVLVVESARAIGCQVTELSGDQIIKGDPTTIRNFLVDLIRARVVHMPGMDEEPSSTFTNMATLFSKLNISVDLGSEGEAPPTKQEVPSAKQEKLTYEERAALRKAERERKRSDHSSSDGPEMTYEERVAQRRLERERRRKEREALAK